MSRLPSTRPALEDALHSGPAGRTELPLLPAGGGHNGNGHQHHHAAQGLTNGTRAPDVRLPDLDGEVVDLADFRGRLTVLLFWSPSWTNWVGFLVVVQNIISSLFNSHLFDFQEGWIYVLGVGVAGGMALRERRFKSSPPRP